MLLQADPAECVVVANLAADIVDGEPLRIKRYTWGEGVGGSAGQRYAVEVVVTERDICGARIQTRPMTCLTAQQEAFRGNDHTHDDQRCKFETAPMVSRWWGFRTVDEAILAALRWEATSDAEPFGWTRASDGRIRPDGDPWREIA